MLGHWLIGWQTFPVWQLFELPVNLFRVLAAFVVVVVLVVVVVVVAVVLVFSVQQTIWDSLLQIFPFSLSSAAKYSWDPRGNSFQALRSTWKLGQLEISWHFTPALHWLFGVADCIFGASRGKALLDGQLPLLSLLVGMFSDPDFFSDFVIWLDSGATAQHTFCGLLLQIFPLSSANAWSDLLEPRANPAQANLSSTKLGQSLRGTHSDPLAHPDDPIPNPDDPDDSEFFGRRDLVVVKVEEGCAGIRARELTPAFTALAALLLFLSFSVSPVPSTT